MALPPFAAVELTRLPLMVLTREQRAGGRVLEHVPAVRRLGRQGLVSQPLVNDRELQYIRHIEFHTDRDWNQVERKIRESGRSAPVERSRRGIPFRRSRIATSSWPRRRVGVEEALIGSRRPICQAASASAAVAGDGRKEQASSRKSEDLA